MGLLSELLRPLLIALLLVHAPAGWAGRAALEMGCGGVLSGWMTACEVEVGEGGAACCCAGDEEDEERGSGCTPVGCFLCSAFAGRAIDAPAAIGKKAGVAELLPVVAECVWPPAFAAAGLFVASDRALLLTARDGASAEGLRPVICVWVI